ncbi:MAG TPA: PAS domain S-box protein [Anaerolineales bacterium]|nr:PAS domain S-box protein [Anaerolineales bacterium]
MERFLKSPIEHMLFENHPLPLWIYDLTTLAFLAVNDAAVKKYGYTRQEFLEMTLMDIRPPDEVPRLLEDVTRERPSLQHSGIWRHRLKDGTAIDVEVTSHTMNIDGRNVALVLAQDVTQHKRVEQEAALHQNRLMAFVDAAMDAVISIDSQHRIMLFNPAAEKMFGYEESEILGRPLNLLLPERQRADHTRFIDLFGGIGATNRSMGNLGEVRGRRRSGEEFPIEASISQTNVGGEKNFTAILRDVSERKQSEMVLRESEEKYRTLVENANDGIAIIQNGRVVYVNRRLAEMRGEEASEMVGQRFDKYMHPHEKKRIFERYRRRWAGEPMPIVFETVLLQKGDTNVSVEITAGLISYQGAPAEIVIIRDITERKAAEQALQRQLQEMIALNSVATAGAKATDIDELIRSVTDVIAKMVYPDNCGVLLVSEDLQTYCPHPSYWGIDLEATGRTYQVSEGVVGKVIASGQLIRIDDVHQEAAYLQVTPGIRSEICVPVFVNGTIFGCLNAESRQPNAFTEHDERLLKTVADSLATAIEKILLLQTEKRRREEVEILYNTTRNLVIERDLAKLLYLIVEKAVAMMKASGGGLYLSEPEQRQVRCVVSYNTVGDYTGTVLKYGEGAAGLVAETGEPLIVEDYRTWQGRAATFEQDQSFVSLLSVPLRWQGLVIGVLNIHENKGPRPFTAEDVQIIRHFANHAALAVQNARLFETEQRRRQEAETLRETTLALTYSMELGKLYEVILDSLQKLIPYDAASIELLDQDYFEMVAGRNLPNAEYVIGFRYRYSKEHWGQLDKIRGPVITPDVREDDRFVKLKGSEYIRGWMGIPLFARDKLIGFLNLYSRTIGFYKQSSAAIAQTFGSQAAIAIDNALLLNDLQISNAELVLAYDTTLEGWAKALELRDKETEGHSRRVTDLTLYLAKQFGISGPALTHIRRGVLLHDIGKMGVPDHILKKAAPLTPREWEEMRKHPQYAHDLLHSIPFLRQALDIPYCHHERWDGNGYPRGLRGEQIPLAARIFAVIDVWDALSHDRPYRKAWPQDIIISYLEEQSGILFDPMVVQEFLKVRRPKGNSDLP